MKSRLVTLVALTSLAVLLLVVGCAQSAPAPTAAPAKPAEPTKAAEPTKPAAAAPAATAAPAAAPKATWPEKGKVLTVIIPWAAGGSSDVGVRLIVPTLEKELGISVEVINKPGGGTITGLQEFVKAKPDGYTIGSTNLLTTPLTYLDPERKAPYSRKDFQPLATLFMDPTVVGVPTKSPFKTLQDLIDAAKASPGKVRDGSLGFGTDDHMDLLRFQKIAGVRFATVFFDGGPGRNTALLGGNLDFTLAGMGNMAALAQSGEVRFLATMDTVEHPLAPGVKTMVAQGYNMTSVSRRSLSAPAGTPKEIIDILDAAIKKATETQDFKDKVAGLGGTPRFEDAATFTKAWDEADVQAKEAIDLLAKEQK